MTPPRRTYLLAPLLATMLATTPLATTSYAAPTEVRAVPACSKAAAPAKDALLAHNKHCSTPAPPPPPPPPGPSCTTTGPSPIAMTRQAGPLLVSKIGPRSISVVSVAGGLNASTELDVMVNGSAYGFTKGSVVPWFTLPWSDTEVRIENWDHFSGKTITAVGFYSYPTGYLFGGWQQLDIPIVMGDPPADACPL